MEKTRVITLITTLILSTPCFAMNYPSMAFEEGINITKAKELVYSIPIEYYQEVNQIQFHTELLVKENCIFDGWVTWLWNMNHDCFFVRIDIYQDLVPFTMWHELGHVHEQCILKKDYKHWESERYADTYAMEQILKEN